MGRLKDLFIVQNENGTTRVSEAMVINSITLLSSVMVAVGGVANAITGLETEAITAGIVAIGGIILRIRSQGGTIKLKSEIKK